MMRVLLAHDRVGGSTGVGRFVGWMARAALEADAEVTLVADSVDPELASDCRVVTVRALRRLPWLADSLHWCHSAAASIERIDADVKHVHLAPLVNHGNLMTCHHLARAAWDRGVREDGRGFVSALREVEAGLKRRLDDRAYRGRRVDVRLTFVSELLRDDFRLLYGEPRDGAVLFPPTPPFREVAPGDRAAARRRLGLAEGKLVAGYLGGNDPRKGFSHVIDLAATGSFEVLVAGPRLDGVVVPGGHVLGYVDPDQVIEASDVLLAPALFEAAGVAVGQALSRGVPVVVGPANGWAGPVARHGAGVVLGDLGALRDAVAEAAKVGPEACRAAAAEVSEDRQAVELLNLYERVRGDHATGAA
jgi:glycosyltransferase involved in cell wall biosynthesis